MWRQGEVHQDFKDPTIVHLYKRKGNRQFCDDNLGEVSGDAYLPLLYIPESDESIRHGESQGTVENHQKFDCSMRFIQMVRQLHDGMMARVTDNGAVSEALAVTNAVKQGCVLEPTLFSLIFSGAYIVSTGSTDIPGANSTS
nr:unnamed protein product [Spirometra erinaceieuropaei]